MTPTAETRPCAIMMAAAPATDTKPVKISTRRGHLRSLQIIRPASALYAS